MTPSPLMVYLVDDEPLAIARLARLLGDTGRAIVVGSSIDPEQALAFLAGHTVDALFLDIQMPGMTGFELLARVAEPPPVVFTTAFDTYALRAFDVNSVDYLLKPVEADKLDRALAKLERYRAGGAAPNLGDVLVQLAARAATPSIDYPQRLASRVGDRVQFVDLAAVTHFFARDKLTYASTSGKAYVVDASIAELEARLDPKQFLRIHRSILLNVAFVDEVSTSFAGRLTVRLRDGQKTELPVARDRARALRDRLGF